MKSRAEGQFYHLGGPNATRQGRLERGAGRPLEARHMFRELKYKCLYINNLKP